MDEVQQYLKLLDNAVAQLQATREDHIKLQQAVRGIQSYIDRQDGPSTDHN